MSSQKLDIAKVSSRLMSRRNDWLKWWRGFSWDEKVNPVAQIPRASTLLPVVIFFAFNFLATSFFFGGGGWGVLMCKEVMGTAA